MSKLDGQERLYALDNLRAIMMWLGVVLHVAINHITTEAPTPWRDSQTSVLADLVFLVIHAFRMPVFFLLAAFLAAMLVERSGYRAMMRNRVRRLALPFAVFWPLLLILMGFLVINYRHLMLYGTFGWSAAAHPPRMPDRPVLSTMHLWFIYYLFLFCAFAALIGSVQRHLPTFIKRCAASLVNTLSGSWWGCLLLAIPPAVAGSGYPYGFVAPYGSFIPTLPELLHNGMFFLAGWYLYQAREVLLPRFTRSAWLYLAAGWVPMALCLKLLQVAKLDPGSIPYIEAWTAYAYGLCSWLWSFGLIGLFLRYLPRQHRVLGYIADSSYWVFLVHMLGTLGFGALLYNAPLGAAAKMAINIVATTAFTLITYQLFVRHTRIGIFLNGKKPLPPAHPMPSPQAS